MSNTMEHTTSSAALDEYIFLKGWPTLERYIRTMKDDLLRTDADLQHLVDDWRAGERNVRRLQADDVYPMDLPIMGAPHDLKDAVVRLSQLPLFRSSFGIVPSSIRWVPINRLVVFQRFINVSYAEDLIRRLALDTTAVALLDACLPLEQPPPDVRIMSSHDSCTFVSASTDLRAFALGVRTHDGMSMPGTTARQTASLSVDVGFGVNCVSALLARNRLILLNGMHRVYAAMSAGYQEIPCVVQELDDDSSLPLLAAAELVEQQELYFESVRPPLLRDFSDARVTERIHLTRRKRCLRVTLVTEEFDIPA